MAYNKEGRGRLIGWPTDKDNHGASCDYQQDGPCNCPAGTWDDADHADLAVAPAPRAMVAAAEPPPPRVKSNYVGPPAYFHLHNACHLINEAFGDYGCYLVGSATERADYRDVDVRFIMKNEDFDRLFPCASVQSADSHMNPRWNLICTAISEYLRGLTGLPIDFQIQRQSHSNSRHRGKTRHPLGGYLSMEPKKPDEADNHP